MAKRLIAFLIFFPAFFFISSPVFAAIPDKFVVIVNPVREKILWRNRESVERQIKIMEENNVLSTWLLQYSVVKDRQTVELFDNLNSSYEIGVLLEVNEELANESFVPYLYGRGDWARADKVLLSGYKPDERKRMIDGLFEQFRLVFGRYPESVGAWYIDTDSLNYVVNKYRIKSVMDVADQYQTDSYGVWGQPWGTPYYPSRYNSILPASSLEDQLDVVTIQWAVRDPVLGYGLTVYDSTYSVQANDYINHHGFDTNYFGNLVKSYLNSSSVLSQLTIGLEAGQEGAVFLDELEKQINWIKETERESTFVTMFELASFFKAAYRDGNPAFFVTGVDPYNKNNTAYWFSSPYYRAFFFKEGSRFSLDDLRIYDGVGIFYDSIEEDGKDRLLREIPACIDSAKLKDNKLITDDLKKIDIEKNKDSIKLVLSVEKGSIKQILLTKDNIIIDGDSQITDLNNNDVKRIFIKNLLRNIFDLESQSDHSLKGSIKYSILNGQWYFGWMAKTEQLTGITSKFPYFGVYPFPFQILSYFKSLPKINFIKILLQNFVPPPQKCTIKL